MKKVVLIDDHPIYRDGIRQTLTAAKKYAVVHEASSVASLASYLKKNREQLADVFFVIDISLPDGSGFELLPLIAAAGGITQQCVMLSMHDDYEYAEHAFALNAFGYVVKSDEQITIVTCLESLGNGEPYVSPGVKAQAQKGGLNSLMTPEGNDPTPEFSALSRREADILKLVAEGKTNREISEQLFLSQRTIENHRAKICRKLGVSGPNGLISLAIKYKRTINLVM